MFDQLRNTSNSRLAGILRLLLGLVFVMAGVLKVTVPHLGEAFEGQLAAAEIPFRELSLLTVPYVEILAGSALLPGWHPQLRQHDARRILADLEWWDLPDLPAARLHRQAARPLRHLLPDLPHPRTRRLRGLRQVLSGQGPAPMLSRR